MSKAEVLAHRVIADQLENGEVSQSASSCHFQSLNEQLALSQSQESIGSPADNWMES
jgi:hypothetical protein